MKFNFSWDIHARTQLISLVPALLLTLLLTGFFLLVPALPLVYGTIAWTPYAERYLYMPAALWVSATLFAVSQLHSQKLYRGITLAIILLLPLAGSITYARSVTWQNNLSLFEDTARKAPHHLESQGIYMVTLALHSQLDKARQQHQKIQAMANGPIAMKYDYNYAYLAYAFGRTSEANEVLASSLKRWAHLAGPKVSSFYHEEWQKMYGIHLRLSKDLGQLPMKF